MSVIRTLGATIVLATAISFCATAWAEDFNWIMVSISNAGKLSNGDGHYWTFVRDGDDWKVVGKDGQTARVAADADNVVQISGFPRKWKADGEYKFSRDGAKCTLRSSYSRHNLKWDC